MHIVWTDYWLTQVHLVSQNWLTAIVIIALSANSIADFNSMDIPTSGKEDSATWCSSRCWKYIFVSCWPYKNKPNQPFESFVSNWETSFASKDVVPLNEKIMNGNEVILSGGLNIITAVHKRKYQMICCAVRLLSFPISRHYFVQETRKENGKAYSPSTIRALLFGGKWQQIGWAFTYWTRWIFHFATECFVDVK